MNYRFTLNISNDLANNTFERPEADLEGWVNGAEPDSNYLIEGRLFCCVAEKYFFKGKRSRRQGTEVKEGTPWQGAAMRDSGPEP